MFGLKLTKLEADILSHRMEVPDAIEDYVCETSGVTPDELATGFEDISRDRLTPVAKLILKDCIEGSTYYGASVSEGEAEARKVLRAGRSLAKKISVLIGEELDYPNY